MVNPKTVPRISVVVPTYNERDNIATLVERLRHVFNQNTIRGSIIVVDDSSPDGTAEVVRGLQRRYKSLILHQKKNKEGIGAAYKFAFPRCRSTYVVEMDADLSHAPEELPRFIEKLEEGYDLVVGSRYIKGGTRRDALVRRVFPMIGNFMFKYVLGFPVTDTTSGYRAYRRSTLDKIDITQMPNDFSFKSAMVFEFMRRGFRVTEVPISFRERERGVPKYGHRDLVGNIVLLLKLFVRRLFREV